MKYALRFAKNAGDYLTGFHEAEFESLCNLFHITNITIEAKNEDIWIVSCDSQSVIEKLVSRSVFLKTAIKLFCFSNSRGELFIQLQNDNILSSQIVKYLISSENGFKVLISTVNKTLTASGKIDLIEELLGCLPEFEIQINLKDPGITLHLLEDYEHEAGCLSHCYLGISLPCEERSKVMTEFSIKKRHFIGNTTMDPVLSAAMSNIARVDTGNLVLDPFVGTGGIVLLCAYHGGYCFGSDLDYKTVHGVSKPSRSGLKGHRRAKDECIRTNFYTHGFEERFLDVCVNDACDIFWKNGNIFDAIVTDPPYGIREGIKMINSEIKLNSVESHASMQQNSPIEMFKNLVDFAAKHLKKGGRLVFWMPSLTTLSSFEPDLHIPKHPGMNFVHFCSQTITNTSSRCLVCLEKIDDFAEDTKSQVCVDYYDLGPEVKFRDAYLNSIT